jgi:hypothetical protein
MKPPPVIARSGSDEAIPIQSMEIAWLRSQ